MLVSVRCEKCGETAKLDIGDMTKEQVEEMLNKRTSFECFGHHMEMTSPMKFWKIDWGSLTDGKAPTEEEFINNLKSKYKYVYENKELSNDFTVTGFSYGLCVAVSKVTGKNKVFDFARSPKGERYYFAS